MKKLFFYTIFTLLTCALFADFKDISDEAFPFSIFSLEKDSEISAYYLNEPITENHRITVSQDGHLYANGKRIRIFGTNLSEIPTKNLAEEYAQLFASQGYNCIRFHHLDSSWVNGFLKKNESGAYVLNEQKLDDFDYFFNELKKNGIYSNINLLTGRTISSADGLPKEIDEISDWKNRHCYGFWNETARNIQKDYAKTLLTHINPYTGLSYLEDPAVAIVEINNETGMLQAYLGGWLEEYPEVLWQELEKKWNTWLAEKNFNYKSLAKEFNVSTKLTPNMISSNDHWNLEQHNGAKAEVTVTQDEHKIRILKNGTEGWHIQYNLAKLSLSTEKIYTLKFTAKASKDTQINVSLMQAHDPWANAGYSENLQLSNKWQDYSISVSGIMTDDNLRLNFGSMGYLQGTTVNIKNISLQEGGKILPVSLAKDSKSVLFPKFKDYQKLPDEYRNLILNFIYDVEDEYWGNMQAYLKNTLKGNFLLMGTAVGCSTQNLMSRFDIIDTHAYWHHPIFPQNSWDQANFYVKNQSATTAKEGEILTNLASLRVFGKPFSVSEYDHPYPNQFSAEMYTMISTYAAFQDWDCIYSFCSELPDSKPTKNEKITGYFDQTGNPAKACAAPLAARIFRQGLVTPAKESVYLKIDESLERQNLTTEHSWGLGSSSKYGLQKKIGMIHKIGITLDDFIPENGTEYSKFTNQIDTNKAVISDTQEIYWDTNKGVYAVNSKDVFAEISLADKVFWQKEKSISFESQNNDFHSFTSVKQNNKYLIFCCNWSGNKYENLTEFNNKIATRPVKSIRDTLLLTTSPGCGRGPAMALSGNGKVIFNENPKLKLYFANINGNSRENSPIPDSTVCDIYKTLWYIAK